MFLRSDSAVSSWPPLFFFCPPNWKHLIQSISVWFIVFLSLFLEFLDADSVHRTNLQSISPLLVFLYFFLSVASCACQICLLGPFSPWSVLIFPISINSSNLSIYRHSPLCSFRLFPGQVAWPLQLSTSLLPGGGLGGGSACDHSHPAKTFTLIWLCG